jgi:uncharacterized membrane protein
MQRRLAQLGLVFMMISSIAVALWSERLLAALFDLWVPLDAGIRAVVTHYPLRTLTHMLVAPLALLLGPFQFIASIRSRAPRLHRYMGRIYVLSCVISGVAGLATAVHASGGPVAGWGFGILAFLWVGTTLAGWRAAVRRNLPLHRLMMRLSYAMTFGAVTLRLQIPIGLALGFTSYSAMSPWLAYTSWIPNVLAVLIYSAVRERSWVGATRFKLGQAHS